MNIKKIFFLNDGAILDEIKVNVIKNNILKCVFDLLN